jgi:hypothetical protein
MNYLEWDIGSNLAKLNGTLYSIGYKDGSNYFEHGRHAIFFSNPNEKYGYKFFVVKGICYELSKIIELYNIHSLMFSAGFGVKVFKLCSCYHSGKMHYGFQVEKLSIALTNENNVFPFDDFKSFCRSIKGLIKRENYYEELYGVNWNQKYPHLEFNVGDNNIMYDNFGNPKIIDIDPRWQIKK